MDKEIDDLYSLGLEPFDILGFGNEQELMDALVPLMLETDINL